MKLALRVAAIALFVWVIRQMAAKDALTLLAIFAGLSSVTASELWRECDELRERLPACHNEDVCEDDL